jgi:hypothetical protein
MPSPSYIILDTRLSMEIKFFSLLIGVDANQLIRRSLDSFIQTLPKESKEALEAFRNAALKTSRPDSEIIFYDEAAALADMPTSNVAKYVWQKTFKKGPKVSNKPTVTRESVMRYVERKNKREERR